MRVHRLFHLLYRRFEMSSHHKFGNQLTCMRTDDVRADNLAVLLVANDFYEAFRFTSRPRATAFSIS